MAYVGKTQPRHLTEDQVAHFRDAFNLFDADGGGSIDAEELGACLRSLGQNLSETEIHEMIVQWDLDDKGTISFEGFLAMISSLTDVMDIEKEMLCAFSEFDQRGSGRLNKDEFIAIFTTKYSAYSKPIAAAEVENMIKIFDALDPHTQEVDYHVVVRRMMR